MNYLTEITARQPKHPEHQTDRTAILILGMHRSGTSFLSSLVQSLGISVGENLYPADAHNPAGYFEDQECVDIQERLLEALGQPWHGEKGMMPFPSLWWRLPEMRPLIGELESWIDRRISSGSRLWALKDPRTTRFLPLWQELLQARGITPRYLLAVRDPAEVIASEVTRDNVPAQRIYHTWLRYNMEALLHAGGDLAGIFIYAQWFTDGIAQLKRLAAALNVTGVDDEFTAILDRLLRPDLHRQDGSRELPPTWAAHLYVRLQELATRLNTVDVLQLATEAEYFDGLLRRGENPALEGPLEAILLGTEGLPEALQLAHNLRAKGARVVLGITEQIEEPATSGVAIVTREYNGPELLGGGHLRAAHALWHWLRRRAYAAVHIEGGQGLASHCLDARRQGIEDDHGIFHVHYFKSPPWLQEDGRLRLRGLLDAEALCLERRILAARDLRLQASPTIRAMLRHIVADEQLDLPDLTPEARGEPLVSVCITHYNRPDFLNDCLTSVRAQTYKKFEVVLVDDGSTQPAARAFLTSLQDEFNAKGWTLILQENRYLGAARNTAARAARGDYLFILDDDNLLMPDGIQRAVLIAQHTGADIVTAVMAMFHGQAGYQPTRSDRLLIHAGNAPLLGLFENTLGDASALMRRSVLEALGGYTEDRGLGAEDWELFAKAVLNGMHLEHSIMPLSWYRVDTRSMSRTGDWWRDYRRAIRPYEAVLPSSLRELPALAGILKRRVGELEPLEAEVTDLSEQLNQAHADALVRDQEIARSQHALQAAQQSIAVRDQEIAVRDQEIAKFQRALPAAQQAAQQSIALLHASTSWRITAPMRWSIRRLRQLLRVLGMMPSLARKVRAEMQRHGGFGFVRRIPYYVRRRATAKSLLQNPPRSQPELFQVQPAQRRERRVHPDLLPSIEPIDASISIVIPTYNGGPEFAWLLRKLRSQKGLRDLQIVIVDSGSTDETVALALAAGCTLVEIPQSEFSHSGARNLGAEHATSDYVLFMVQDAYPIGQYWALGMLRYLRDHENDGLVAVSCSELPRSDSDAMYDSMIDTHYRFLGCRDNDRIGRFAGADHMALRQHGQLSDVACLIGRDTFARYRYHGDYAEDLNLGMRIIRDGLAVAMLASVKVVHSHNRPAYYYLKRSFVDVIYLAGMFDDFICPTVKSPRGLVIGIVSTAAHISTWLQQEPETFDGRLGDAVLDLVSIWRGKLTHWHAVPSGSLGDTKLEAYLEALAERCGARVQPKFGEIDDAQQFVDMFLARLEHFGRYASTVYPCMDHKLYHDFTGAVCKTFAATAGAAFGFAYMSLREKESQDRQVICDIHDELKAGV